MALHFPFFSRGLQGAKERSSEKTSSRWVLVQLLAASAGKRMAACLGGRTFLWRVIPGTSKDMGPLYGKFPIQASHIFRDSYGSGMGIEWETYHKGVPLLGVPENPTETLVSPWDAYKGKLWLLDGWVVHHLCKAFNVFMMILTCNCMASQSPKQDCKVDPYQ